MPSFKQTSQEDLLNCCKNGVCFDICLSTMPFATPPFLSHFAGQQTTRHALNTTRPKTATSETASPFLAQVGIEAPRPGRSNGRIPGLEFRDVGGSRRVPKLRGPTTGSRRRQTTATETGLHGHVRSSHIARETTLPLVHGVPTRVLAIAKQKEGLKKKHRHPGEKLQIYTLGAKDYKQNCL